MTCNLGRSLFCHKWSWDVPVDPIGDVQRPIDTERGQVMCRNSLRLSCPLEHKQLRENSDGFEENGERPKDFCEIELVVEDEGEDGARSNEVFNAEGIDGGVIGGAGGLRREPECGTLVRDVGD